MSKGKKTRSDIQELAIKYKLHRTDRNFSKLIEAIDGPLYVFLKEYIDGYENIRTVMAQTYEVLWQRFDTYDVKYKFITWAYFISRNIALNYKRQCKYNTSLFDKDSTEPYGGDFSDLVPCDAILREQFLSIVLDSIKKLPEPYCTAMYLKDIKNLSFSDIAEMLNVNVSTVRWRLFKARKDVGEYLSVKHTFILDCIRYKQT